MGIDWAIDLTRISIPIFERCLPDEAKNWFHLLPIIDGRPNYLWALIVSVTPRKEMFLPCQQGVLELKKFSSFWKLIIWPETSLYLSRISLRILISLLVVMQKGKQLSTNKMWEGTSPFTHLHSMDVTSPLMVLYKWRKSLCTNNKKVRWKWVILP